MPVDAPAIKLERTRALGAEIILYDRPGGEDRDAVAKALCEARGGVLVHAYADPWVIEGQGSAGIEINTQMQAQSGALPSQIIACCGGGGLTAGLALACPDSRIIPVEPDGWDDVCRSLESGVIQKVPANAPPTACDALQTPATQPINFTILQQHCQTWLRVSEAEVRAAQRYAFTELRLVLEPGGSVALAAALAGKIALDENTVIILTGGNADPASFAATLIRTD